MSLDKSIRHGKEYRKQYTGAKSTDKNCRNHGNCEWCKSDREYSIRKRENASDDRIKDYET